MANTMPKMAPIHDDRKYRTIVSMTICTYPISQDMLGDNTEISTLSADDAVFRSRLSVKQYRWRSTGTVGGRGTVPTTREPAVNKQRKSGGLVQQQLKQLN